MNNIIKKQGGSLIVSDTPIIPYIEGDGTGPDIWSAAVLVFEEAVKTAYQGKRRIEWKEVLAGQKAYDKTGEWLPKETEDIIREYLVCIKGPLATPVGGGIRSLNVALRQKLDLYICLRPIMYFQGIPSPVKKPELVDMVVFRENTEDVYAGFELESGSEQANKLRTFLKNEFGWNIRENSGLGIKPISPFGTERLVRAAIEYAIKHNRKSVTLVHKGNIMKFTEGAFRQWGYDLAKREFGDKIVTYDDIGNDPVPSGKILIKDAIADAFLQQIMTRANEFDVIATMNLNGDYLSDALAAQVGGIGIAPGANIGGTGHAVFEATHGTAPKYAGKNMVNPSSVILSGMMMLEYIGWQEAADLIYKGIGKAIEQKVVTYDFARLMDNATKVSTSGFAEAVVSNFGK